MREPPTPKPAFVLKEVPTTPRAAVTADTPGARSRSRPGTASAWLSSRNRPPANGLRMVNRLWQQMFGSALCRDERQLALPVSADTRSCLTGLARTSSNTAGTQRFPAGAPRLPASARRRSSREFVQPVAAAAPARRLTPRCPRSALAVACSRNQGGQAHPYQLDGLWNEAMAGRTTRGRRPDLYWWSMHNVWKRTVPPADTMADAADCSVCLRMLGSTSTFAQALLNDPQRGGGTFGQRMLTENAPAECGRSASRRRAPPTPRRSCSRRWPNSRMFAKAPADAEKLLAVSESST